MTAISVRFIFLISDPTCKRKKRKEVPATTLFSARDGYPVVEKLPSLRGFATRTHTHTRRRVPVGHPSAKESGDPVHFTGVCAELALVVPYVCRNKTLHQ